MVSFKGVEFRYCLEANCEVIRFELFPVLFSRSTLCLMVSFHYGKDKNSFTRLANVHSGNWVSPSPNASEIIAFL